jgi:hypothetical protein
MSYSPQAFTTATTANLGEIKIGSGFLVAGDGTVNNGGVTQLTGAATIKVSGATGSITLTDVGVLSVAGTTNQVTASASTGAVTLSLPQSIATTSAVTFNTATISSGNIFAGSGATSARFPSALIIASTTAGGIQQNETTTNIGIMGEAVGANAGNYGVGVYGAGYSAGNARGTGVTGEAHVSATGDTASAIGVRGYSNDTHAGGLNVGLFGDASGSATGNYALYMNAGNIYSGAAQTWYLNGNLTFNGAYTVTLTTITATNGISFNNGSATVNSTLNDYETGTFTPLLTPSSGSAVVTYGATVNVGSEYFGRYTKIGNMVFVQMAFVVTAIAAGGTGSVTITGLPFTTTSTGYDSGSIGTVNNISHTGSRTQFGFRTNPGTTSATMWEYGLASGAVSDTAVPWSSLPTATQSNITVSLAYRANF